MFHAGVIMAGWSPGHLVTRSPCHLVILTVLCGFLFFHRLADRDLWSSHEGRAAQDAQTILDEGAWGLPRLFDRKVELQKPPLYYWLVAGVAQLGGRPVDAWAVRLPAALAALGGVLGVYLLLWWRGRPTAGLVAALVLATAMHYTWLARVGRIDMPLTLAVGVALGALYLALSRKRPAVRGCLLLIAYLSVAAAVLLKGPIGAALPAAVGGVYLWSEGRLPSLRAGRAWLRLGHDLGLWWGVPLVLGLVVPWFLWAGAQTHGELFRVFFWHHNIERGFGGADDLAAHPFWFYAPRLTYDLLPWSVALPAAAWRLCRRGGWRADPEMRFGFLWLLTLVLLLSCMRFKRADYLLPAYPGAALLLGAGAERWYRAARDRARLAGALGLVVFGCVIGWGVYLEWVLPRHEPEHDYQRFAAAIRQQAPRPQPIIFFRVESHPLAFRLGAPIDTILEWENLDIWSSNPGTHYVVMSPDCAAEWPRHVRSGRLVEVLRNTDLAGGSHEHPLILMRTGRDVAP
jgi:4-amino-4-deoxy-L-arabinose transferase-like glycosyltransferase